jgi:hypothetical protein
VENHLRGEGHRFWEKKEKMKRNEEDKKKMKIE